MRTFNVNSPTNSAQRTSFLAQRLVTISIQKIGIAFPLVIGQKLEIPSTSSEELASTRAFLISLHYLEFVSDAGESSRVLIRMMILQFVPR